MQRSLASSRGTVRVRPQCCSRQRLRPVATLSCIPAWSFSPGHAALGGLILGIATSAQLFLTGRVLGLSGTVKGTLLGSPGSWRPALLLGLAAASIPLAAVFPCFFTDLPPSYTIGRAVLGGLLVGVGTGLGNGCTSGHGICGLARFSPRSLAYTMTFMAAGAVAATLAQSAAAAGIATQAPVSVVMPSMAMLSGALATITTAAAAFAAIGSLASRGVAPKPQLEVVASTLIGMVFAVGLALSGMTLPSKVISFLSPTLPSWDASLAFVMLGALAVATPAYQYVLRRLRPSRPTSPTLKPLLVESFSFPTSSANIDARLLLGGVLFGAGWGLSGMCPGPAVVAFGGSLGLRLASVFHGQPLEGICLCSRTGAYLLAMLVGMFVEYKLTLAAAAPAKARA